MRCPVAIANGSRYNYPGVTNGVTINPDTYAILAAHPNIVGCKM
jgi:2-keto-3-deoxy-L-rhamnonate aldolase